MAIIKKTQNVVVRSSNRFLIAMGNTAVGLLQDLRCQEDYSPEPASAIGSISVKEYVPTMARYTISTSQACMFVDSLRQLGVSFLDGKDAMKGLVFTIQIYDRTHQGSVHKPGWGTGITMANEGSIAGSTLLRQYLKCSFASGDIEIRKHAMVINNATINACDVTTNYI